MFLQTHRLTVEEDGVPTASLVFLIETLARVRMTELTDKYHTMQYELDPTSKPDYVKLTKNNHIVTLHLRSQPFDDGKRFFATSLTIYDHT